MTKLLACIDASPYANSVCDHAAWAAARLSASVDVLHVIQRKDAVAARRDLSGAVGLGAKSGLLEELARIDEETVRLAREQGRLLLEAAETQLREAGIAVNLLHRHGGIVETIIEREADADVIVIGKRGASADFAKGHLGSKVERVVRASIRPVLVAARAFRPIKTVIAAFDNGPSAQKAVRFIADSPLFRDCTIRLVTAGTEAQRGALEAAARDISAGCAAVTAHLEAGNAEDVITRHMNEGGGDMLVMGAYGHSPLRNMIVGSTTTTMIRTCQVPVLLFR
ncbi:universal stress protein [uncultured Sphingosinicella sp.]|uniref:universal stress protein n=1 Tax=uncultured Sphingosinicella sp. TaxID=478748 RepID=UPI0030DCB852|tara:strand:+ start:19246 stop:20091 length:846 start_codon:yes stop_codon:yes gene_type:complete